MSTLNCLKDEDSKGACVKIPDGRISRASYYKHKEKWALFQNVPFLCPHSSVTSPEKLPMINPAVWIINVNLVKFLKERSEKEKKELGGL
jgi:hypothetical protein